MLKNNERDNMKHELKCILTKIGNQFLRDNKRRQLDNAALIRLASAIPEGFAWTSSSVAPRAISVLLNEIIIHRRTRVIECGSGISTIIMAKALADQGGRIVSVDHDATWQNLVRKMSGGLECIDFIHTALKSKGIGQEFDWYDQQILYNELGDQKFDMGFVDAPIANRTPQARFPAFPLLKSYFDESFALFLDDTNREGERKIANEWAKEYGLNLRIMDVVADMALLYPKADTDRYAIS